MLLPCKSLTYNTVYRYESAFVVVVAVVVVVVAIVTIIVVVIVVIIVVVIVAVVIIVIVVVVVVVLLLLLLKMGIKLRNTEMMITRLTIQDTNYKELSLCKIVYSYVKYPPIFFIQVYMVNQN